MKKQIPCMVVTDDQYTNDLREPLLAMGMVESYMWNFKNFSLLVVNSGGKLGKITNLVIECSEDYDRFLIEPYDKEQFLTECRKVLGLEEESETAVEPTPMKHKVGDRVKIKSLDWYNANKNDNGDVKIAATFVKSMSEFCGKNAIIIHCHETNNFYSLAIDGNEVCWSWTDEMFEDEDTPITEVVVAEVAEPKSAKYKVGDNLFVVDDEEVYDIYDKMFVKLGFKDKITNDPDCKHKTGKCFGIALHEENPKLNLYALRFEDGGEVLISENGIIKIEDSEKSEYPKKMLVRDYDYDEWEKGLVICKMRNRFITIDPETVLEQFTKGPEQNSLSCIITSWAQCKEIPETINLTKQQIAEKFGVDPNYLNIVDE